jgi:hypothetical protein
MAQIHSIERFVPSAHLRFAFVGRIPSAENFIIFNAALGPCWGGAPGYQVLNVRACNTTWSPTDGLTSFNMCLNTRPWIATDKGRAPLQAWRRGTIF